jgi:type I restriction enzyme R subunit
MTDALVERMRTDAEFASLIADQLRLPGGAPLRAVEEIIANDEDYSVEFKSTARWDLREDKPNKAMEDAVVKTVAGFLNTDGGTLLIGVDNSGTAIGLDHDYQRVKPQNGDGFVNWLTTHLINVLGHTAVARIRARITTYMGQEICRVDIAAHTEPIWAKTSKGARIFFARFNNSTRAIPDDEVNDYVAAH